MHITMNIPWPALVIAHLREGNTKQKGLDPHIDHHQDRIEMKSLRNAAWSMSPPETKVQLCEVAKLCRKSEFWVKVDLILVGEWIKCS